ncbi:Ribonuclease P protein subunit p40 [Verticillium dahliae VDG2]|nr:Ribonuclease P protein subunit p40 [Verticillium dahliae VDG2]
MVVGLVASLVSTLVHSSKTKSSSSATANPEDQTTTHHQQGSAHSTPCPRDCSICAVVPSLATRYERKQERKDRRAPRRQEAEGQERGLTDGDVPPPYEQEDTRQALDEKNGRL